MRQKPDRAGRGEGGEGARMADGAHQPGRPPAADEEAKEMRRAQQADLGIGEIKRQPRQCIQRPHAPGRELKQDDRQKEGRERDHQAHGASPAHPAGDDKGACASFAGCRMSIWGTMKGQARAVTVRQIRIMQRRS